MDENDEQCLLHFRMLNQRMQGIFRITQQPSDIEAGGTEEVGPLLDRSTSLVSLHVTSGINMDFQALKHSMLW